MVTDAKLETKHRLYLITLFAAGGVQKFSERKVETIKKGDLKKGTGDLVFLRDQKLITVKELPRRSLDVELTDAGWAWVRQEMKAKPPRGQTALYAVLHMIDAYLERGGLIPADLFGSKPRPPKPKDLTVRIREAYDGLKQGHRAWVKLLELRRALSDVDSKEMDAALISLLDKKEAEFIPSVDQFALTEDDRKAALYIGENPRHQISMG
jgi:hypothetical protein